jgi:preprotein translocase SecE subunit
MIAEMKKVTWTRRRELLASTGVVILLSLIVAVFIGLVDFIFFHLLKLIIH